MADRSNWSIRSLTKNARCPSDNQSRRLGGSSRSCSGTYGRYVFAIAASVVRFSTVRNHFGDYSVTLLADAVKVGETPGAYLKAAWLSEPPSIITSGKATRDEAFDNRLRRLSQLPYAVRIYSPYVRAILAAAEAKRKYEPLPPLTVADWNAGVVLSIYPKGTITDLPMIENVIIQRDGATIRPRKADVNLITLQNAMGAQATTTQGLFFFDFSTFEPTSLITVVLVGASTNFEFSLTSEELKRLR